MSVCQEHWMALRKALEDRGLGPLMTGDAGIAVEQMKDQLERGRRGEEPVTPVNYDPLMSAYWAILNNASQIVGRGGGGSGSALYVMTDGPEDPIEGYAGQEGKTWPRCAVCYLNLAHKLTCRDRKCSLDTERGYDWMIDRAADEEAKYAARLGRRDATGG